MNYGDIKTIVDKISDETGYNLHLHGGGDAISYSIKAYYDWLNTDREEGEEFYDSQFTDGADTC